MLVNDVDLQKDLETPKVSYLEHFIQNLHSIGGLLSEPMGSHGYQISIVNHSSFIIVLLSSDNIENRLYCIA